MNAENNAVVPRRRGQEILKEMLLAERHELVSTPLTRREEIAECERLLERLACLTQSTSAFRRRIVDRKREGGFRAILLFGDGTIRLQPYLSYKRFILAPSPGALLCAASESPSSCGAFSLPYSPSNNS